MCQLPAEIGSELTRMARRNPQNTGEHILKQSEVTADCRTENKPPALYFPGHEPKVPISATF